MPDHHISLYQNSAPPTASLYNRNPNTLHGAFWVPVLQRDAMGGTGVLGLEHLRFRSFCLFCPSMPALRCLGWITGAGGLPRLLGFSGCVRFAGPCRASGGCRTAVSVALVAKGVVSWFN